MPACFSVTAARFLAGSISLPHAAQGEIDLAVEKQSPPPPAGPGGQHRSTEEFTNQVAVVEQIVVKETTAPATSIGPSRILVAKPKTIDGAVSVFNKEEQARHHCTASACSQVDGRWISTYSFVYCSGKLYAVTSPGSTASRRAPPAQRAAHGQIHIFVGRMERAAYWSSK